MSPSPDNRTPSGSGKLRVLVVDDEPTLRLGFAYALSSKTTVVETAPTGRHALERIANSEFDIMILDLRMPELDGLSVLEMLRDDGNEIPIVLCSAVLSPNAALRAFRRGVVDFLLKPVRPADLRQVIEFVIHPGHQPFSLALQAARRRQPGEAIRILEEIPAPGKQAALWLGVFRSIRDMAPEGDTLLPDEASPTNLSGLAFNAPSNP